MVSAVIDGVPLSQFVLLVVGGVLGGDDESVTVLTGCHPFSEPRLRLLVLIVVRGIDEVSARLEIGIQESEGGFFVHATQESRHRHCQWTSPQAGAVTLECQP